MNVNILILFSALLPQSKRSKLAEASVKGNLISDAAHPKLKAF